MKKIYFVLVKSLLLGFAGINKANGQCEYCQYPYICNVINYSIFCNGQLFPVEAVICYNCDQNNRAYYVQVLEISYPAEFEQYYQQCSDELWDNLWNNVRSKLFQLCGFVDCSTDSVTIYRTIPLCGEFIFEGPPYHEFIRKRFHPGLCNLRCVVELRVCFDFNTGQYHQRIVSRQYYGFCPPNAEKPPITWPGMEPIRKDCVMLWYTLLCP